MSPAEIIAMGLPPEAVKRVVKLIKISEYKRRQSAVGIRITPRGYFKEWRAVMVRRLADQDHVREFLKLVAAAAPDKRTKVA